MNTSPRKKRTPLRHNPVAGRTYTVIRSPDRRGSPVNFESDVFRECERRSSAYLGEINNYIDKINSGYFDKLSPSKKAEEMDRIVYLASNHGVRDALALCNGVLMNGVEQLRSFIYDVENERYENEYFEEEEDINEGLLRVENSRCPDIGAIIQRIDNIVSTDINKKPVSELGNLLELIHMTYYDASKAQEDDKNRVCVFLQGILRQSITKLKKYDMRLRRVLKFSQEQAVKKRNMTSFERAISLLENSSELEDVKEELKEPDDENIDYASFFPPAPPAPKKELTNEEMSIIEEISLLLNQTEPDYNRMEVVLKKAEKMKWDKDLDDMVMLLKFCHGISILQKRIPNDWYSLIRFKYHIKLAESVFFNKDYPLARKTMKMCNIIDGVVDARLQKEKDSSPIYRKILDAINTGNMEEIRKLIRYDKHLEYIIVFRAFFDKKYEIVDELLRTVKDKEIKQDISGMLEVAQATHDERFIQIFTKYNV